MTKPIIKITAIAGALVLLVEAALHMLGLAPLKSSIGGVEPALIHRALSGIWVMPSVHWILIVRGDTYSFRCFSFR